MSLKTRTDRFLSKAVEVHGDKYDYGEVSYVNARTKVNIICREHGSFAQTPDNHLRGNRCPSCSKAIVRDTTKLTTAIFISRAIQKHGDFYDYSKAVYENGRSEIVIICPKHGKFTNTAEHHLKGVGCRECGYEKNTVNRSFTLDTFLTRAREVHGDRYDYSKVIYTNSSSSVSIGCSEHGPFDQVANSHLQGKGCKLCANIENGRKNTHTLASFMEKAKDIHGTKYDYTDVVYINSKEKVSIYCPLHGSFDQTPSMHTQGTGCPSCGYDISKATNRHTLESFITKAREVHGDEYTYSKVNYENSSSKVTIGCIKHGYFDQEANGHLRGIGCPRCGEVKKRKKYYDKPTMLYYLKITFKGVSAYKIGITTVGIKKRYRVDLYDPLFKLETIWTKQFTTGKEAYEAEQQILSDHSHLAYEGRELLFGGNSELFKEDIYATAD